MPKVCDECLKLPWSETAIRRCICHGFNLDLGCGPHKNKGFVGSDKRDIKGVDLVFDIEELPWPIPSNSVDKLLCSHVMEHMKPWLVIGIIDEMWRVMKHDGQTLIAVPYAGSFGFHQDPSHCLLDGAEVLTEKGFKVIQKIKVGEKILTFNLDTNRTEFSKCKKIINERYVGSILQFKNRGIDVAVTPNHDLVWKTRVAVDWYKAPASQFIDLVGNGRVGLGTIPDWIGKTPKKVSIPQVDNELVYEFDAGDFMELLGWIISEGCFVRRGNYRALSIHQSLVNLENRERIKSLISRMDFKFNVYDNRFDILSHSLFDYFCRLGTQGYRYIPVRFKKMSRKLLLRLLEGLRLGDGEWHNNRKGYTYTTISKRLADDVNEIAVKCRKRSTIWLRLGKRFVGPLNGKIYKRKDQYRVSVGSERLFCWPVPKEKKYVGRIVCVSVEKNQTIFTRYNGKTAWVGNCKEFNQASWSYFDPEHESMLYTIYEPKPWKVVRCNWSPYHNMEVVMEPRKLADGQPSWILKKPEDKKTRVKNKKRKAHNV